MGKRLKEMVLKSKLFIPIFGAALIFLLGFSMGDNTLHYFEIVNFSSNNAVVDNPQLFSKFRTYARGDDLSLYYFINTVSSADKTTESCFGKNALLTIGSLGSLRTDRIFSHTHALHNLSEENNVESPFQVSTLFSIDTHGPHSTNGLDLDKYLGTIFDFQKYKPVNYGIDKIFFEDLTVGIHGNLRNNDKPLSNRFINKANPVPIPLGVWIFGAGLIGIFGIRRKLNRT